MRAYQASSTTTSNSKPVHASDELRIGVTLKGKSQQGITKMAARLSSDSILEFGPNPGEMEKAIEVLKEKGFVVSGKGRMTLSVRGTRGQFEQAFGTKLAEFTLPKHLNYSDSAVFFPPPGAPWNPDPKLAEAIDDAYIQWPHIYMGTVSALPPNPDYHHLSVLADVPRHLNVTPIHDAGHHGAGIKVAMIDTGFAHSHPFFVQNGFTSNVVLAPSATNRHTDPGSHGTGESANVFAIAPKVTFIGVKLDDDSDPRGGASLLEGFLEALKHQPHIITVSSGYDLRMGDGRTQMPQLPGSLKPLEAEIAAAVARGIVVIFAAGNGHYAFPGSMPDVISAGGTHIDEHDAMEASDYASAFCSEIYSGRNVPDFCGLVGMLPDANYIMLPVPQEEQLDVDLGSFDGTSANDGWAVFSGTSAAAPQLAGICALLIEKNPTLTPAAIKALLVRTARDVVAGKANPASDLLAQGLSARPGRDGATGAGLVDAHAAWLQA